MSSTSSARSRDSVARVTSIALFGALATVSLGLAPAAQAADTCPNSAMRQQQGATVAANCRAYEMVSPVANNSASVFPSAGSIQASVDGDSVKFETQTAMPGSGSAPFVSAYLATRAVSDWNTKGLNPTVPVDPYATGIPDRFVAFSPDLSRGVLRTVAPLTAGARHGQSNLFTQDTSDLGFTLLTPPALDAAVLDGASFPAGFSGWSADGSKTFFETAKQFTSDAIQYTSNLYERDESTGQLSIVGVLPGGLGVAPGGAGAGTGTAGSDVIGERAVSADGSRVFFTTPANSYDAARGDIYLRRDASSTVDVSRAGTFTDPNGLQPAQFWFASADGASAVFTSPEKLTGDATTGPSSTGNDLYLWREGASPRLVDLTPDTNPSDLDGAVVQGVLGTSDDLSSIYFAATGDLAPGATSGSSNVYLWHAGAISYVGDGAIAANWDVSPGSSGQGGGQGTRASRVTPDGRYLLFASTSSLTGYDNAGYAQLFRFAADDGSLSCVSCNPRGAAATGAASFVTPIIGDGSYGTGSLVRAMTPDGQRVFFNSPDRLVHADANSRQDVYEWQDGQVSLISSGVSDLDSFFADASLDGDNVFFTTFQRLVGQDRDISRTLYDARVNGGIAAQTPPDPGPPCEADGCRPPLTPSPVTPTAATVTFSGAGSDTSTPTRAVGKVKLAKATVSGSKIGLTVRVPAAGRVSATGSGLRSVTRRVTKAGTVRLSVSLTSSAQRALRRHGAKSSRRVTVKVTYRPTTGPASTATANLTIKA
jgi:hypothetical protein